MIDLGCTIDFTYGTAEYSLNMPWAFTGNDINSARRLMTFMCKNDDPEHEAAKKTLQILYQNAEEAAARYKQAGIEYHDGWAKPEGEKAKETEKENKRLKRAFDRAGIDMRKAVKIRDDMLKIYTKYIKS